MDGKARTLWDAWIEANRVYRAHQGSCAECAQTPDIVGCSIAFELYQVRETARYERDNVK